MKPKYRRDLKQAGPPNEKSVKFKEYVLPHLPAVSLAAVQDPWHTHSRLASAAPAPTILPHPCPTPQGQTLERLLPQVGSRDLGSAQPLAVFLLLCCLWSDRPQSPVGDGVGDGFHEHLHLSCVGHWCFSMK